MFRLSYALILLGASSALANPVSIDTQLNAHLEKRQAYGNYATYTNSYLNVYYGLLATYTDNTLADCTSKCDAMPNCWSIGFDYPAGGSGGTGKCTLASGAPVTPNIDNTMTRTAYVKTTGDSRTWSGLSYATSSSVWDTEPATADACVTSCKKKNFFVGTFSSTTGCACGGSTLVRNDNHIAFGVTAFRPPDYGSVYDGLVYDGWVYDGVMFMNQNLKRGDRVYSKDRSYFVHLDTDGTLNLRYGATIKVPIYLGVNSISINPTGTLQISWMNNSITEIRPLAITNCVNSRAGVVPFWRFNITDGAQLITVDQTGVACYTANATRSNFPNWSYNPTVGTTAQPSYIMVATSPRTDLYMIDSIWKYNHEALYFVRRPTVNTIGDATVPGTATDFGHLAEMWPLANRELRYLDNRYNPYSIPLTSSSPTTFSERQVILALKSIVDTANNNAATRNNLNKVVNFSGFFNRSTPHLDCAYQIMYYNRFHVVTAAGNNNTNIVNVNRFKLTVGGYNRMTASTYAVHANSGYGVGVDVFAPYAPIDGAAGGTSIATLYTSMLLSHLVAFNGASTTGTPVNNFNRLMNLTRTNVLSATDPKVQASGHSRTLYVPSTPSTTWTNSMFNSPADKCGAQGLTVNSADLPTAMTYLQQLADNASDVEDGGYVIDTVKPKCPVGVTRC